MPPWWFILRSSMQIDPHPSQHDAGLPRAVFRLQPGQRQHLNLPCLVGLLWTQFLNLRFTIRYSFKQQKTSSQDIASGAGALV